MGTEDERNPLLRSGTVFGCVVALGTDHLFFSSCECSISPCPPWPTRNILNDGSSRTIPQTTACRYRRLSRLLNEQRHPRGSSPCIMTAESSTMVPNPPASLPAGSAFERLSTSNLTPHPVLLGHGRSTRLTNPPGPAAISGCPAPTSVYIHAGRS